MLVRRFLIVGIAILIVSFSVGQSKATMVLSVNLEQMTETADRIFLGTVQSVEDAYDSDGRWCQFVTFSIIETYKGNLSSNLKIKQVNSKPTDTDDETIVRSTMFQGVPQYKVGEEVVVFLHGDSPIGFTSPVGLSQGAFRVVKDDNGGKKLVNGAGNLGLFKKMKATPALKAQGIDSVRFQALSTSPKDLYLDQMRSMLKALTQKKAAKE